MKKVSGAPSPANSSTVPGSNLSQSPTANTNRPDSWKSGPHIILIELTITLVEIIWWARVFDHMNRWDGPAFYFFPND